MGIYEIPLVNNNERCLQYYLGSTSRNISKRLSEHKADIAARRIITALVAKFYEQDINIDWDNARVVKTIYTLCYCKTNSDTFENQTNC